VVKGLGGRVVDRQRVWRGLCELEMHVLEVQRCGVWLIGCSGIRRENQGRGFVCEGCYFWWCGTAWICDKGCRTWDYLERR